MSLSGELLRKYEDYLLYDEEGDEIGLKEDAPEEARKAYEQVKRLFSTYNKNGVKICP